MAEEWLADSWAWHIKDLKCKQEKNHKDCAFWNRLLAFAERHISLKRMLDAQEWQATIVVQAVEATEDDPECSIPSWP